MISLNTFVSRSTLDVDGCGYEIYRLDAIPGLERPPYSLKVLAENLLRIEDGANITADHVRALAARDLAAEPDTRIQFTPARVVMQDFTGVPCIVDLATMREAVADLGGDPEVINPLNPAEMVTGRSVQIDSFGLSGSLERSKEREHERNAEHYQFPHWGQGALSNFRVVPPGTGIIHQVNIECLARIVSTHKADGVIQAYPDTCVDAGSRTIMVNGLGALGWGVDGIKAKAAMLDQPVSMLIPKMVGFKLSGAAPIDATATDVVLTITEMLRVHGVVDKFVEFYGEGVAEVPLANHATIGNMSPEFGSTAAIFPIDKVTLDYLHLTGRSEERVHLVEAYTKAQGMWHDPAHEPVHSEYLELDLSTVVPSIVGPEHPQDRIVLSRAKEPFQEVLPTYDSQSSKPTPMTMADGTDTELDHGHVTIASITSCTNTSNPSVMMTAGLLARNAVAQGLRSKPWVRIFTAPDSQVITDYYEKAGLWPALNELGFNVVGYGCATCIGNSGPLPAEVSQAVNDADLAVVSVLSGNRNFEGRINPDVKINYLASPPLVIVYALAGAMDIDFATEPLGQDPEGRDVFLSDIWPDPSEVQVVIGATTDREMYTRDYADVFAGDECWQGLDIPERDTFAWDEDSTYVRKALFFEGLSMDLTPVADIEEVRVLALLGDSVTTDHISPAGATKADSPAGRYLAEHGVAHADSNSYGSRHGNHKVMIRGTFANVCLRNQLLDDVEGGYTRNLLTGEQESIFDASQVYQAAGIPLMILGDKECDSGSSRDWTAKDAALSGVKAVIAESFERTHRSNLIGMGVIPLQLPAGQNAESLGLDGTETFSIMGLTALNEGTTPRIVAVTTQKADGLAVSFDAVVRIDTPGEADYPRHGGILQYVLRRLVGS